MIHVQSSPSPPVLASAAPPSNQNPQMSKRRSCATGVKTMQSLAGVSYRFCHASFTVRASAHLRCAETKKWACLAELRHIFIDNRSAVLLHHTTATACLGMECQMTQRSYLECNHRDPADLALSAAASSVGSTARSIVHIAR